ncbi:MAG: rhamnulokinase [Planctomycetes bacterium]|nr:rhamnulokinase [Planctomycetota bacterium]
MAQTGKAFAAVDLGASGGKVFVGSFAGGGFELREVHRFDNGGVPTWAVEADGTVTEKIYWDVLNLFNQVVLGLRKAADATEVPIESIGIDTWGADAGLLNEYGELLSPVYCYRDHRLDDVRDELSNVLSPRELFDITGLPSQPFYLLNQLFWLKCNRPDLLAMTRCVVPIGSLLQYHLCGSTAAEQTWMAVQELTMAGTADYDDRLLEAAGVDRSILPEVVAPGTVVGLLRPDLAEATGLGPCKIVATKMHDTASAFTAAPVADRRKGLIISSGTWSLVGRILDEPLLSDAVFEGRLANEGVRGDVRLLRNVMGTWPVQQLREAWMRQDGREISWDAIAELAQAAPVLATLVDVDDQAIYNPPDMEAAIRAQIARTGQAQPSGRGELLRAVYEGLALKVREVNAFLQEATGDRHEVIHVVGGGARNGLLNQFIADATGLPVKAGPYEATCIGNILVQAVAAGQFPDTQTARAAVDAALPTVTVEPEDSTCWAAAADALSGWHG